MRSDLRWLVPSGLLISLGSCLSCPMFVLSMSPGWTASFDVENLSGEPVRITPLGVNRRGERVTLPREYASPPNTPAIDRGAFPLAPHEVVNIKFDYDHVNFSEVLVQDSTGGWHKINVLPDPSSKDCCGPPVVRHVVISPLNQLPLAEQSLIDAAVHTRLNSRVWVYYALLLAGPLFLALGVLLLVGRKSLRRSPELRTSPSSQV